MPRLRRPLSQPDPPAIAPATGSSERPRWSVMIPTLGRSPFLGAALHSVLEQDPGAAAMQIEIVDNGDDHEGLQRLVHDLAGDRVRIFRQPAHLPMAENWNTCVLRSRGELVHLLNDDDEVLPGFYDAYSDAGAPGVALIAGQSVEIDEAGRWIGVTAPHQTRGGCVVDARIALAMGNLLRTPAVVVPRATYEAVGGFLPGFTHAPDWEMWNRAAAVGPVAWVAPPRALYRIRAGAASASQACRGENIRDGLSVVELLVARLDSQSERDLVRRHARDWLALIALQQAKAAAARGDRKAWWANARLAAVLRLSARTWVALLLALVRGRRDSRAPDPMKPGSREASDLG